MQNFIRCKACGYIMKEGSADVCPACGVPKTAFEPYKMTISEKRRKILELHIHPILLHFPQAFTLFALALSVITPLLSGSLRESLLTTAKVVITLLPFTVALGFISGIYDGKTRFKKLKTPILRKKIIFGSAFFVCSIISAVFIYYTTPSDLTWIVEILFLLVCTALSALLGKMGGSLMEAKMPG